MISLTSCLRGKARKQKKVKPKKKRGVKNPLSEWAKPGSVTRTGKGRGTIRMFPQPESRPQNIALPSSSESDDSRDSREETIGGTTKHSCSPLGGKPDQVTPQMVTHPMGTQTQGDVTSPVTGSAVTSQDNSPVHDSARPSSPTTVT